MTNKADQAIVNAPLARRGDIDKQLGAYKVKQLAEKKAKRKKAIHERKKAKEDAKRFMKKYGSAFVVHYSHLQDTKTLEKVLSDWIKWEPEKLVMVFRKWMKEMNLKDDS